jgi:hypothetical protein
LVAVGRQSLKIAFYCFLGKTFGGRFRRKVAIPRLIWLEDVENDLPGLTMNRSEQKERRPMSVEPRRFS